MYPKWKGKWAVVTGASSGIGEEIARQLAASGVHLVLVARRAERLRELAAEFQENNGIHVKTLDLDLSQPESPEALWAQTVGEGMEIAILVNNAGVGNHGPFARSEWNRLRSELQLNVIALAELTHRFVRTMQAQKSGWILNVASTAAFLSVPGYATYGAGKSFVLRFSEAVRLENKKTGVVVSALCPGPIRTEFAKRAGHHLSEFQERFYRSPVPCARAGLRGLYRGKAFAVYDQLMALSVVLMRFIPRSWASRIAGWVMRQV